MVQRELHHLLTHAVGNPVPELRALRRPVFQIGIAHFQVALAPAIEGAVLRGRSSFSSQVGKLYIKTRGEVTLYRPPLLSAVVDLFLQYPGRTQLQIDYKNVFPMRDDEPLRRFLRLIEPLGERVLVSSGADWHLRWMRRQAAWLDLGFDIGFYLDYRPMPRDPRQPPYKLGAYGYHDDHILALQALMSPAQYLAERCEILLTAVPGSSTWYVDHHLITRCLEDDFDMAALLHERGVRLDAWTLDIGKVPDADILRLRDLGVDQFTTNTPGALTRLFAGVTAQGSVRE